jgi:hypothetical protein
MDSLTTAIVGVISVFIGYLISLWRSRLRPWISLLNFGETRKRGDTVEITKKISNASKESWFMKNLPDRRGKLGAVSDAFAAAKIWLEVNEENEDRIESGISQLKSSRNPEDMIKAISFLLGLTGISDVLELSISRSEIIPNYDADVEPEVKYFSNDKDKDGCFSIDFPPVILNFGSNFNTQPYRKDRLLPMVELISRLEKDNLVNVFEKLRPIWKNQMDVHKVIVEEAEQIIDNHSRWMCEFSITNFGATPFILFPESAIIYLKGKHIKPFELESRILCKDKDEDWVDAKGVMVIKSGTTENLAIVTKNVQKDIEGGEVLRGIYKSGDANAVVKIQVLGREIPWKRWIKSTTIKFQG